MSRYGGWPWWSTHCKECIFSSHLDSIQEHVIYGRNQSWGNKHAKFCRKKKLRTDTTPNVYKEYTPSTFNLLIIMTPRKSGMFWDEAAIIKDLLQRCTMKFDFIARNDSSSKLDFIGWALCVRINYGRGWSNIVSPNIVSPRFEEVPQWKECVLRFTAIDFILLVNISPVWVYYAVL